MKSKALINTSIVIAGIGIVVVLLGLFSPFLFRTSLNSPIYFGLVMFLAIASIVLGGIQIWPILRRAALQKSHTLDKKRIQPSSADSMTDNELWTSLDVVENEFLDREEKFEIVEAMLKVIAELPPRQREALVKELNSEIGWKNVDVSSQRSNPIKVTTEVKGTPITIESPDAAKVEDIVKSLIRDFQAPIHTSAELKMQPGIIREDKETYQTNDSTE